ncbi:mast cell protease 1A-like isoform X2 [Lepisosteus oculatus]
MSLVKRFVNNNGFPLSAKQGGRDKRGQRARFVTSFVALGARQGEMALCPVLCLSVLLLASQCGTSRVGIVGGREAAAHSRPYMASLQENGTNLCGGVLVREDFVLTAAHCAGVQRVVLGAHSLVSKEEGRQVFAVRQSFLHPLYPKDSLHHDIMLLKLDGKAALNERVQAIPLKHSQLLAPGTVCSTAGWGDAYDNDTYPGVLQEVNTTVISQSECSGRWAAYYNVTDRQVCAAVEGETRGFCSGDSGGPLICNGRAVGVISFSGPRCGDPRHPDIYTRVASFREWIIDILSRN